MVSATVDRLLQFRLSSLMRKNATQKKDVNSVESERTTVSKTSQAGSLQTEPQTGNEVANKCSVVQFPRTPDFSFTKAEFDKVASNVTYQGTLIVFDWDDTLLPSSWLSSRCLTIDPACEVLPEDRATLCTISVLVYRVLINACSYGKVAIITNGEAGWVELSSAKFMPEVFELLRNSSIEVISARTLYESSRNSSPVSWKMMAFTHTLQWMFPPSSLDSHNDPPRLQLGQSQDVNPLTSGKAKGEEVDAEDGHVSEADIRANNDFLSSFWDETSEHRPHRNKAVSESGLDYLLDLTGLTDDDSSVEDLAGVRRDACRKRCMSAPSTCRAGEKGVGYFCSLTEGFIRVAQPTLERCVESFDDLQFLLGEEQGVAVRCFLCGQPVEQDHGSDFASFDSKNEWHGLKSICMQNSICRKCRFDGTDASTSSTCSSLNSSLASQADVPYRNVISFGDSDAERYALVESCRHLPQTLYKSVKLNVKPGPTTLNDQLELVIGTMTSVVYHGGILDLQINWPIAEDT